MILPPTWTLKRHLAVTWTIDLSTVCRQHSRSVVPETAWLRGHRVVLVNESAQHVVTTDVLGCRGSGGGRSGGHVELDTSMRTLVVVVADILTKDSFEVTLAQNEQPVEALRSDGPHPTFCIGICPRRANRRLDHPGAF